MRTPKRITLLAILIASLGGACVLAQSISTVQITGAVKDSSGAVVPGALVTAKETTTGFTRSASTGVHGQYILSNLPIGPYTLKITHPGFSTYTQTGIVLRVASNPTIDATLQVGGENQVVQVRANAAMVETHTNGVGEVVSQRSIVDLPLNGRQATNLILLAPGTAPAPGGDLNTNKNYPTQTISVAGGLINGIAYYLDGASNNDPFNSLNLPFPFPDALQEFKVQTSSLPAQYGAHASAAVNVVTKSGTNAFHGDLFEFVRNGDFNANNFFNNAKGLPRDSLKRNQFGGTIGGPIVKNKLFFFAGYQGTITRSNPPTKTSIVPTAAMLSGDFTAYDSADCQGSYVPMSAPFVTTMGSNGQPSSVTVNPSLFSAPALKFLKNIPTPTDPCGAIDYGISQNSHDNQIIGRVDYTKSSKQSMFFRYFIAHYVLPVGAGEAQNILEANQVAQNDQDQDMTFGDNYAISPNAVNVFTLSLARTFADRVIPPYPTPASLGIPVYSPIPGFMGISVGTGFAAAGGFSLGAGGTNPGHFNSTAPQIADDFTWVRGNHQIQFGVNWIHAIMNTVNNRPTNGAFSFGTSYTGLAMGDFLMGDLSNFLQGNPDWENDRENLLGAYIQDSWRISPSFTFNYGLRWAPQLAQYNWRANSWIDNFSLARFQANQFTRIYKNSPAGLIFPGDADYPGTQYTENHWGKVEPRVGIIWDPSGNGLTSVRAGYGLFYDRPQMFFYTRMSNNPPWGASINLTDPGPGSFDNPWANYPGGNPWPGLAAVGKDMPFPEEGVYVNVPLQTKSTYVQQWNLSVERQLDRNDAISISYLGNETTHLWLGTQLNPGVYSPSASFSGTPAPGATCAPVTDQTSYNACQASLNSRRLLTMLNPVEGKYFSTIGSVDDGGTAAYDGLLVSEQHRFSDGLSFRANWTWSHCITDPPTTELTGPTYDNPADRSMDRGSCASDIRHIVNASMVGNAPWHFNRGVGILANDWRLSVDFSGRWGSYSTAGLSGRVTDPALNGMDSRAEIVSGQNVLEPSMTTVGSASNPLLQYANPDAFAVPDFGTYGNAGVATIPNPGFWNADVAISRIIPVGEDKNVQLRWEMFNAFNNVNFDAPNTGFGGSNAGTISSAEDPRIMQFALKYSF